MDLYDDIDDDYPLLVHGASSTLDLTSGTSVAETGRTDSCSSADTFLPNYGPDYLSSVGGPGEGYSVTLPRPRSANPVTYPTLQHHTISSQLSAPSALYSTDMRVHDDLTASKQENFLSVPRMKFRPEVTTAVEEDSRGDPAALIGDDDKCSLVDSDVTKCRLNLRRAVRNERRYHTADTIEDINKRDNSIQKRLSWNYGTESVHQQGDSGESSEAVKSNKETRLRSADSLRSVLSSSGVSSTVSLHVSPERVARAYRYNNYNRFNLMCLLMKLAIQFAETSH